MQTFDKETFKKSIIDNVKNQYRKTISEGYPAAGLSGCRLCR